MYRNFRNSRFLGESMFLEIRKFPIFRRVDNFFDKKWWFFRKILDMHVWSSISLSFAQKFAALKNLKLSKDATIRYKLDREKCRFTFAPVLAVHGPLAGFKPMIISKVKGTRWANQLRVETKKIVTDSGEYNLERRHFPSYVLYSNSKAWMTADLFIWEMERISTFLKKNHPGKKYCILMDNCSSHKRIEFENLEIVFSLHQQQGYFNPLIFPASL